jgi:hypothetical protein
MIDFTQCCQTKCTNKADYKVFWPGRPALPMCIFCAEKAKDIAEAMGMYLHTEEIKHD